MSSDTHADVQPNSVLLGDAPVHMPSLEGNFRACFPEIIGRSESLTKVLETVSKIARSESAVLISGESGTGKELIAAALHRLSPRAGKRFVPLNCSAIPENLLESELFGHEKGAFTGAVNRRPGHFEMAEGGTLFLDEIGDMPQRLQAKLLRVLQEKQYTSVGGTQLRKANVRIVAATNLELSEMVKRGNFRLDLFYRLNVLPIHLPSLCDRREDIPDLLEHFLEQANRLHDVKSPCYLNREALLRLTNYSWPGNVRELQNLIERLVVMRNGGEIRLEHLPDEYREEVHAPRSSDQAGSIGVPNSRAITYPPDFGQLPVDGVNLPTYIEQLENDMILQALERTGYNKNQAAKLLGLNRTTLVERIKKRRIAPLKHVNKEA